ncbi:MAG: hypothetical protein HYW38_02495 [Candidatus Colwellbacteria bacterium]|nr:hypothetical protein [Candidatus Colwellbacteria bacterium]
MIDGVASKPFSAETLEPKALPHESFSDLIIENSRHRFGTPRPVVEKKISSEWLSEAELIEERVTRRGEERLEILTNQPSPRKKDHKYRKPIDKARLKEVLEQSGNSSAHSTDSGQAGRPQDGAGSE